MSDGANEESGQFPVSDGFTERWGWVYNLECIAKLNNFTIADAGLLNVVSFMNQLSYIRDKTEHDNNEAKKQLNKANGRRITKR